MSRHLLLAPSLAIALAACNGNQESATDPAAAPAPATAPELIPRDALFGNPERANVQISPDGQHLSWVAPVEGVLNVWVAPAADPGQARPGR